MRFTALVGVVSALAMPAVGLATVWYWPVAKVMHAVDGARVRVGARVVRINTQTTLCSGEGRSIRRRRVRIWSRFTCTFTTFARSGVDRDLEFEVYVIGRARYAIRDAHWVGATR